MYKSALDQYLEETRFKNIDDILGAFSFCEGPDDIKRVLGEIPAKFGTFCADLLTIQEDGFTAPADLSEYDDLIEEGYPIVGFRVYNFYTDKDNGPEDDSWDFDWYD